jgi:hypothetical protein
VQSQIWSYFEVIITENGDLKKLSPTNKPTLAYCIYRLLIIYIICPLDSIDVILVYDLEHCTWILQ